MKFECDLIRDLMPLCADDAASDASKKAVQTHIAVCTECAREWDSIRSELTVSADAPPPDPKYADAARRYRNKRAILIFVGFLAMLGLWYLSQWLAAVFAPVPGYLTPEEALQEGISKHYDYYEHNGSDIPDYDIKYQYEWTDEEDRQCITYFVLAQNFYDFICVKQIENGRYSYTGGFHGISYDATKPLIIFEEYGYYPHHMSEATFFLMSGMTRDAQVASVAVNHFGTEQTLLPDETGFFWGIFPFPEDYDGDASAVRAYDANGQLLYELTADDEELKHFSYYCAP